MQTSLLYIEGIIQEYHRKEKYKRHMQRPGFLGEEDKPDQRRFIF